jgi:hypothetical protein
MRTIMTLLFCKRTVFSIVITLFLILLPGLVFSQTTGNHTVSVSVNAVTVMQINGGTRNLNISSAVATAGVNKIGDVTDGMSLLLWGTNSTPRKITIRTNITPVFSLKAQATNITMVSGMYATTPEVTFLVQNNDYNFITGIGCSSGSANVLYTASALASQGIGTETHTITFTITTE